MPAVLWLRREELVGLDPLRSSGADARLYFSSTLLDRNSPEPALTARVTGFVAHPYRLPASRTPPSRAYPRPGLGPGQRFMAKGGYIVRYTGRSEPGAGEAVWLAP